MSMMQVATSGSCMRSRPPNHTINLSSSHVFRSAEIWFSQRTAFRFILCFPYTWPRIYVSARRLPLTGEMRGWSCAMNVMAHMIYMETALSNKVDLQMLWKVNIDVLSWL